MWRKVDFRALSLFTDIAGNVINITIVVTSGNCTDGKYNKSLFLRKLEEEVTIFYKMLPMLSLFSISIYLLFVSSGSETDWLKENSAFGVKNILFNSTVFLMSLDCIQTRVLSNLELKRLFTIFLLFNVFSCFVFGVIIGWVLFWDKYNTKQCDKKKNFAIEVALLKKQTD